MEIPHPIPLAPLALHDALALIDAALRAAATPRAEILPVRAAAGRVLMADLRSRLDLPPVDKSAMDGYAVLAGDDRAEYRLVETMPAGAIVEFLPIRGARS